jgi:threonine dehydrogenase-like Zn-dependent dehydrogenase
MNAQHLVFTEPYKVELQEFAFEPKALAADEVAIQTQYSLISPGTELACLSGKEWWAQPPFVPGYAGYGEVIAIGDQVADYKPGDKIFAYTQHSTHVKAKSLMGRVPAGLDGKKACYARMAAVAITALQVSVADLGDYVAVFGLGLVGNFCAQLFTLAGCQVIGIDLAEGRRALAKRCGVPYVIDPAQGDLLAQVEAITGAERCATVVEATGVPAVALQTSPLVGKLGEVILLGTPRGEMQTDITPFLQNIHLWGSGCVTYKGGHEWRTPVKRSKDGSPKHSIERNIDILLRLINQGKLHVDEMTTHVVAPTDAAAAYVGLRTRPEEYIGVLFDWSRLG